MKIKQKTIFFPYKRDLNNNYGALYIMNKKNIIGLKTKNK